MPHVVVPTTMAQGQSPVPEDDNKSLIPYEPAQVSSVQISPAAKQRESRLVFLAFLSSNLFGLCVSGIYEFLSLRGIVNIALSRVVLIGVWAIGLVLCWIVLWAKEVQSKVKTIAVSGLVLASLLVVLDVAVSRIASSNNTKPSDVESLPHVQVSLVIDAVTKRAVEFHFDLENIGNVNVSHIHPREDTADFFHAENDPQLDIILPPKGKLSLHGLPRVLVPQQVTSLVFTLEYIAELNGSPQFVAKHWFYVKSDRPKVVNPETWSEHRGAFDGGDHGLDAERQRQLAESVKGTLFMIVYETLNGAPNTVSFAENRKRFLFDPIGRSVSFGVSTTAGKRLDASLPLEQTAMGHHLIILEWDCVKGGIFLKVDGKSANKGIKMPPSA